MADSTASSMGQEMNKDVGSADVQSSAATPAPDVINEADAGDKTTAQPPEGSSPSVAHLAKGTVLLRLDGSKVAVEDVQPGDALLGPDGRERRVIKTSSGKERLFRIRFRRSSRDDLVVGANHTLMLHREKLWYNEYAGPSMEQHQERFADQLGELPPLSSDPADPGWRNNQTKHCDNFHEALKKAVAWILGIDRGWKGAAQARNVLNGTTGIMMLEKCYIVHIAVGTAAHAEHAIHAWGREREKVIGHPNHPPVFFDTKEEAFAAAVAKSRELHDTPDVALENLIERFELKSSNGKQGEVKLDARLPNISLLWNKNGSSLKLRAYCSINYVKKGRYYAFPEMPSEVFEDESEQSQDAEEEELGEEEDEQSQDAEEEELGEQEADDSDADDADLTIPALPDVAASDLYVTVEKTAAQFAALSKAEKAKHRPFRSPGFELPHQDVPVKPHFVGLFLSDGERKSTTIINYHEEEVREFLIAHAAELDLHLVYHGGLKYATVAKTRLANRPLPPIIPSKKPKHWETSQRPEERTTRHTIYKQRLAAGWTLEPRDFGGPRIWHPPLAISPIPSLQHSAPPTPLDERQEGSDVMEELSIGAASMQLSEDDNVPSPAASLGALRPSSGAHSADVAPLPLPPATHSSPSSTPPPMPSSPGEPHGLKHDLSSSGSMIAPVPKRNKRLVVLDSDDAERLSTAASLMQRSALNSPVPSLNALLGSESSFMAPGADVEYEEDDDEDELNGLIDFIEEDDEQQGEDEEELSDDEEQPSDGDEELGPRRVRRAEVGARGYGDLQDDELEALIDDIIEDVEYEEDEDELDSNEDADEVEPAGRRNKVNTLLQALRGLGIITPQHIKGPVGDRKHVPQVYLKNSRAVRLQLLAGFLDGDGALRYPDNFMSFIQSERWHSILFWDMVALARSLGFGVSTKRIMAWNPAGTTLYPYLYATLSGDLEQIPCLLIRKQAFPRIRAQSHSFLIKDISLEAEETEWAGVQVDGDQQYLRDDYLVLHNGGTQA